LQEGIASNCPALLPWPRAGLKKECGDLAKGR
jgi:hypothetical protein